jgi:diacylglycerol kinase (ATP)
MLIPGPIGMLTTISTKKWRSPTDVDLKTMVIIPEYLSKDMANAVKTKGEAIPEGPPAGQKREAPTCPILVFTNSKSGGRLGPELMKHFEDLISSYQVSNSQSLFAITPFSCRFV